MLRRSLNAAFAYDPLGVIRTPREKASREQTIAEMAEVICLVATSRPDGCVMDEDFFRAGFTREDIARCQPEAVSRANDLRRKSWADRLAA